jgi:peptidoglycan/LPS O-acetylase OafA/YrhL
VPWSSAGHLGVDVFFVLSATVRLGAFYLRRVRRLYPALLGLMVLYAFLVPLTRARTLDMGIALAYLSDYAAAFFGRPEGLLHTWSLSVEEHYYLLWPLVLPFVLRSRRPWGVLLAGFVLATAWRMHHQGADLYRFDTRLSGLLLGSMLAVLPRWNIRWGWVLLFACEAMIALRFSEWSMTAVELATASAILYATQGGLRPLGALSYIGRISYGIYLFHYPINSYLQWRGLDWPGVALGTLVVSLPLAMLSFHTIERWCRTPTRHSQLLNPVGGV